MQWAAQNSLEHVLLHQHGIRSLSLPLRGIVGRIVPIVVRGAVGFLLDAVGASLR